MGFSKYLQKIFQVLKKEFFILIVFSFISHIFSVFCEVLTVGNYVFDISQKNIKIPVQISSNKEFAGFQVNLSFDPKIINVISVNTGDFVSSFNVLSNTGPGFVRIAGFSPNLSGISGTGIIAYIDFQLISPGLSNIILSGKVSDKEGKIIPFSFMSGKIEVKGTTGDTQAMGQTQASQQTQALSETQSSFQGHLGSSFAQIKVLNTASSQSLPQTFNYSVSDVINIPGDSVKKTQSYSPIPFSQSQRPSSQLFTPLSEDPSAKDNCVLFIISEYGNPQPPNGFYTYRKGDKVECKVEKEIIVGDEKYVCDGFEGYGSVDDGETNYINFTIISDTKIKWRWKKIK
ncbi:MAG: cohesin domain-containing protein [Candidatus Ratteibacteria bacterium]